VSACAKEPELLPSSEPGGWGLGWPSSSGQQPQPGVEESHCGVRACRRTPRGKWCGVL